MTYTIDPPHNDRMGVPIEPHRGYRLVTEAEYQHGMPIDAQVWSHDERMDNGGYWQERSKFRKGTPGVENLTYRTKAPLP